LKPDACEEVDSPDGVMNVLESEECHGREYSGGPLRSSSIRLLDQQFSFWLASVKEKDIGGVEAQNQ